MKPKMKMIVLMITLTAACAGGTASPTPRLEPSPVPTPTQGEPIQVTPPYFEASECVFDLPEGAPLKCGYVTVPEDHFVSDGKTIRLATVIVMDQSEDHQPDPVILLAGGPGERVVNQTLTLGSALSTLHPKRDLIIFDQRGVGESDPALECPEFVDGLFEILDEPDPNAANVAIYDAFMACRDRLIGEGHNLAAYTTAQSAADVDSIRRALGYERINLYGGSYGSLLAQATMRDYPDHIRSVAFNSTLPLEASIFVDASTTTANAILRLIEACDADPACNEAFPDLKTVLFEVIDQLNSEPVPVTLTNPSDGASYPALLTGEAVRANLVTFLYISQIIPVLPQATYDVYNGDYDLMTQLSSTRLALIDRISRGMMTSVICNADLVGRTPTDLLEIMAQLPPQLVSSADPEFIIEHGMFGTCAEWPVPDAAASAKEPLYSNIPTLVLEGEFDPVTPPEYGELVAGYLENGYYFEFPGIGHDVLSTACAREIAGAFIDDPSRAPDATCIAEMPAIAFDVPGDVAALELEPFEDEQRGFRGLIPAGWEVLAPANLARGSTALDPTYFVLEASEGSAENLFAALAGQLGLDPLPEPTATSEIGNFMWDLYSFERPGGNIADLAVTGSDSKAFFVYLVSAPDERDELFGRLFLPAVEAMAPTG